MSRNGDAYSTGASDVKVHTAVIGSTSAARATFITPTSGKRIRVISARTVALGLTTDPDATYYYFSTGAAYTTTASKAITAHDTGINGSDDDIWEDGCGPVGANDDVLSVRTETETESGLVLTVAYREE